MCIRDRSGTEQEAIMKEQVEAFNEAVQKQCENVATVSVPEPVSYTHLFIRLVKSAAIYSVTCLKYNSNLL